MLPVAYWRLLGPMAAMKRHLAVRLVICRDLRRAAHVQPRRFGEAAGELMSRFQANNFSTMPSAALVSAPGHIAEPVCSGPIWIRYAKAAVASDGLHPALLEIQHGAI